MRPAAVLLSLALAGGALAQHHEHGTRAGSGRRAASVSGLPDEALAEAERAAESASTTCGTPPLRCSSARACRSSPSRKSSATRTRSLTEATYGHLERDFLQDAVDRLRFEGMPEPEPVRAQASVGSRGENSGSERGLPRSVQIPLRPWRCSGRVDPYEIFGMGQSRALGRCQQRTRGVVCFVVRIRAPASDLRPVRGRGPHEAVSILPASLRGPAVWANCAGQRHSSSRVAPRGRGSPMRSMRRSNFRRD